jgi:hypothetical protein
LYYNYNYKEKDINFVMEEITMKTKRILAAIAASAVAAAMLGVSAMAAGLEPETDVIPEDAGEPDIIDVEPDPAPVEIDPVPVEVTPDPVPNPTTGNSPIALAVIPVALAAAAIVAKKAK